MGDEEKLVVGWGGGVKSQMVLIPYYSIAIPRNSAPYFEQNLIFFS